MRYLTLLLLLGFTSVTGCQQPAQHGDCPECDGVTQVVGKHWHVPMGIPLHVQTPVKDVATEFTEVRCGKCGYTNAHAETPGCVSSVEVRPNIELIGEAAEEAFDVRWRATIIIEQDGQKPRQIECESFGCRISQRYTRYFKRSEKGTQTVEGVFTSRIRWFGIHYSPGHFRDYLRDPATGVWRNKSSLSADEQPDANRQYLQFGESIQLLQQAFIVVLRKTVGVGIDHTCEKQVRFQGLVVEIRSATGSFVVDEKSKRCVELRFECPTVDKSATIKGRIKFDKYGEDFSKLLPKEVLQDLALAE